MSAKERIRSMWDLRKSEIGLSKSLSRPQKNNLNYLANSYRCRKKIPADTRPLMELTIVGKKKLRSSRCSFLRTIFLTNRSLRTTQPFLTRMQLILTSREKKKSSDNYLQILIGVENFTIPANAALIKHTLSHFKDRAYFD